MIESLTIIILVTIVLSILEQIYPQRKYLDKKEFKENILWFIFREIIYNISLGALILKLTSQLNETTFFSGFKFNLSEFSFSIQVIAILILFDFSSYLIHYSLHRFDFLFKFHLHHHSSKTLTSTSAFRQSFYEQALYGIYFSILSNCLTSNQNALYVCTTTFIVFCLFQHSNIALPDNKFFSSFIISPHNHLWHHSRKKIRMHGQNFGFILTIWDKLFDTYYVERQSPFELGLEKPIKNKHFLELYFYPLNIKKFLKETND